MSGRALVLGDEARLAERKSFRAVRELDGELTARETLRKFIELDIDDLPDLRALEPMEHDELVETVHELRAERLADVLRDRVTDQLLRLRRLEPRTRSTNRLDVLEVASRCCSP